MSVEIMQSIEEEFALPVSDYGLNNLMIFQFNFQELKDVIEFLVEN